MNDCRYERFSQEDDLFALLAKELDKGRVIGFFNGKSEFGPRALGARSIIGDPRNAAMQSKMNLKIKYRESFRPFAPSCLAEDVNEYFDFDDESPYMLLVAPVRKERRKNFNLSELRKSQKTLINMINDPRSDLPAITHVDYSARIQTVTKENNGKYYKLIKAFKDLTGFGVIVNTSFNVRGEPIVCSPQDAYTCFMRTEMDLLVLDNFVLYKNKQKKNKFYGTDWKTEFTLD